MGLVEYKKKRSFTNTPEPTGGKASRRELHFVVQKHAASRLHYDFRLEMEGVLKSWAVPKGPSMNPADKRLALEVEDHPYDYGDFEGTIPEGNYGAGTVIVWDRGTYEPLDEAKGKAAREKALLKAYHSGSIKFVLHGEKLRGEFVLVKTRGRADNSWLLIKHRDEFATKDDITLEDQSVKSGKTLEEMESEKTSETKKRNAAAARQTKKRGPVKKEPARKKAAKKKGVTAKSPRRRK